MDILTTAPKRGDIVWLDLDPKKGREQKGHRPVLVISHLQHNEVYQLAIIIPITRQKKGFGIEVPLPKDCSIEGVLLTNQIQSIDWKTRNAVYETNIDTDTLQSVLKRIDVLIK